MVASSSTTRQAGDLRLVLPPVANVASSGRQLNGWLGGANMSSVILSLRPRYRYTGANLALQHTFLRAILLYGARNPEARNIRGRRQHAATISSDENRGCNRQ